METQAEGTRSQSIGWARESGLSRAAQGAKAACQGLVPTGGSEYPPETNSNTEEVYVSSHSTDRHMLILSSCSGWL